MVERDEMEAKGGKGANAFMSPTIDTEEHDKLQHKIENSKLKSVEMHEAN